MSGVIGVTLVWDLCRITRIMNSLSELEGLHNNANGLLVKFEVKIALMFPFLSGFIGVGNWIGSGLESLIADIK